MHPSVPDRLPPSSVTVSVHIRDQMFVKNKKRLSTATSHTRTWHGWSFTTRQVSAGGAHHSYPATAKCISNCDILRRANGKELLDRWVNERSSIT